MSNVARFSNTEILGVYERYLLRERGLAATTATRYSELARRLLLAHGLRDFLTTCDPVEFDQISAFLRSEAQKVSTKTLSTITTALRSFLRFLRREGLIALDLASCVPAARSREQTALRKYLSPSQVERLLASCDQATAIGRRDYAMLLLLARLGLRATELVALTLDDVDWREGEILVRGKGKYHDRLPLLHDVGRAIATYLQHDRRSKTRRLFVPIKGPRSIFADGQSINAILRRALRRAELKPPAKGIGSHLLRHSLATGMLRRGATLAEIGSVLRHRSAHTTTIYARVDIEGLRSIALPWPLEMPS